MDTYDAYVKEREKASLRTLRRREWVVLGVFLVLALTIALNIKRVEVHGQSMEPAFYNGETVIVWKTAPRQALKPGDVIVFRSSDGDELIKRIVYIADPNAPVEFPPPGFPRTISNPEGQYLKPDVSPIYTFDDYFTRVEAGDTPTPPRQNTIYVQGDNLLHSDDSRDFGPISPKQLMGKVIP